MRTHYFSRVIIRFFMNVQAEDQAQHDDEDEEELKAESTSA
jgi:hypothetical protein